MFMFSKLNEYQEKDKEKSIFFATIAKITSLSIDSENAYDPFSPAVVLKTSRSSSINDLSDDDICFYRALLPKINNPELLSRVADVLWVTKKEYKSAIQAIDAYLQTATILRDKENWPPIFERVERAFRIAVLLGGKSKQPAKVINYIKDHIQKRSESEKTFLIAKYLSLFLEYRYLENAKEYSHLCWIISKKLEEKEEWYKAREYLNVKSKYETLMVDDDERPKTLKYISDLFIKEGESYLSGESKSYSHASHFYEKALVAIRESGEFENEQKEIHKTLLNYQKMSLKEFKPITQGTDISSFVKETENIIKGKSFIEALFTLASIYKPTSVKLLRQRVEENSKYFVSRQIFGGVIVNEKGMITGRYPNRSSSENTGENEDSIRAEMISTAQLYRQIVIPSYIEPARSIINLEHAYKISDLNEIVNYNPFIPPGREYLFAKGLYEGLKGDYINASHILIPQIENSIRYLLQQNDELTSGYSSKGIQDERPLTVSLVDYPILKTDLLGEDLHHELSSILIDRYGSNLRNRLAHGLIDSSGFITYDTIYLWWLTLKICCDFHFIANPKELK